MSTELDKYLSDMGPLPVLTPLKPAGEFPLIDARDVIVKLLNPDTQNQVEVMLPEVLKGLAESGGGGGGSTSGITVKAINHKETSDDGLLTTYTMVLSNGDTHDFTVRNGITSGYAEGVRTIDGIPIDFFVGEQTKYTDLPAEKKDKLFAIITDDPTQKEVIDGVEELIEWKKQAKKYVREFSDIPQLKKGSDFEVGTFPKNRGLDEIVGIGLEIIYEPVGGETYYMHFSGNKTTRATSFPNPYTGRYEVSFCATAGITEDKGACGMASMNIVVGARNNTLYLNFENGSLLWMDDSDENSTKQGVERLDKGNFYLSSVSYWFA